MTPKTSGKSGGLKQPSRCGQRSFAPWGRQSAPGLALPRPSRDGGRHFLLVQKVPKNTPGAKRPGLLLFYGGSLRNARKEQGVTPGASTSEPKGRKYYVPCFAVAAVNSGGQNGLNLIYYFRNLTSEIIPGRETASIVRYPRGKVKRADADSPFVTICGPCLL